MRSFDVDLRAVFAECLCTAFLVYFGVGTALTSGNPVLIALVFGTVVTVLIYMAQHSNAGQLNPAVSIALALAGYVPYAQAVLNCLAQFTGGVIGSALLFASMSRSKAGNLGANKLGEDYEVHQAVVAEIISALLLQLTVFEALLHPRSKAGKVAPVAIGFVVFIAHSALIPIDGCSLNPARSFGPALLTESWDDFWIFFLCPIIGCALAIPAHVISLKDYTPKPKQTTTPTEALELA